MLRKVLGIRSTRFWASFTTVSVVLLFGGLAWWQTGSSTSGPKVLVGAGFFAMLLGIQSWVFVRNQDDWNKKQKL